MTLLGIFMNKDNFKSLFDVCSKTLIHITGSLSNPFVISEAGETSHCMYMIFSLVITEQSYPY